jgi:ubiquinone/menaquinone biosynthesis C-methylase UbiE
MTPAAHSVVRNEGAQQKSKVANFNRLARLYRWMEYASFGPWLWWCRCTFLNELTDCRRAAIFGDGDGRFTARLLSVNQVVEVDAVDASKAMLHSLMSRASSNAGRVHVHCSDVRQWQPASPQYDLIVTHFFLDCLTTGEVRALAAQMHRSAVPGAQWVVSEFVEPSGKVKHVVARAIIWLLYRAFGLLTGLEVRALPDHHTAMREAGFVLEKRRAWLGGLLISELWRAQRQANH